MIKYVLRYHLTQQSVQMENNFGVYLANRR